MYSIQRELGTLYYDYWDALVPARSMYEARSVEAIVSWSGGYISRLRDDTGVDRVQKETLARPFPSLRKVPSPPGPNPTLKVPLPLFSPSREIEPPTLLLSLDPKSTVGRGCERGKSKGLGLNP